MSSNSTLQLLLLYTDFKVLAAAPHAPPTTLPPPTPVARAPKNDRQAYFRHYKVRQTVCEQFGRKTHSADAPGKSRAQRAALEIKTNYRAAAEPPKAGLRGNTYVKLTAQLTETRREGRLPYPVRAVHADADASHALYLCGISLSSGSASSTRGTPLAKGTPLSSTPSNVLALTLTWPRHTHSLPCSWLGLGL